MQELKDVKEELRELRTAIQDNNIKLAEYNILLSEHIRGVRHLDERMRPVEDHVKFVRQFIGIVAWAFGIGGSVAAVLRLFLD